MNTNKHKFVLFSAMSRFAGICYAIIAIAHFLSEMFTLYTYHYSFSMFRGNSHRKYLGLNDRVEVVIWTYSVLFLISPGMCSC